MAEKVKKVCLFCGERVYNLAVHYKERHQGVA